MAVETMKNNPGRWYKCPYCGAKVQKLTEDSIMMEVPLYCKKCKMESYPCIYHGRELEDDEPLPGPDNRIHH